MIKEFFAFKMIEINRGTRFNNQKAMISRFSYIPMNKNNKIIKRKE